MNRNDSSWIQTNRPAARRLMRRPSAATRLPCVTQSMPMRPSGATVVGLPKDVVRAAGMFELLAAEMRIAELEKELADAREQACLDPLTGALNRRGFDRACARELARMARRGASCALALIDLDDFKCLNDRFGHAVGDRALTCLVDTLTGTLRPTDILGRLGGEEFVLMLPDTGLDDARITLERLLRAFSATVIPEAGCVMSFSAGVVLRAAGESITCAIERADAAMYRAKRGGKRQVVVG